MIVSKNIIDNYFEVYILLIYTVFNTKGNNYNMFGNNLPLAITTIIDFGLFLTLFKRLLFCIT